MNRGHTHESGDTGDRGNSGTLPGVLVTGASGGIGRAVSIAFGKIGWYVGVHYGRNRSAAATTLRRVVNVGGTGALYQADLRESEAVRQMVAAWQRHVSKPAALVCSAGIGPSSLFLRHSERLWDEVIATNLTATFHCMRAVAPVLCANRGGSIIVIGSHTGFHGAAGQVAYATSKAGLIGLVKTAALEWGPQNVRVNLVLPGWQKTKLTEQVYPKGGKWLDHALLRPPAIEEAARTIVHLSQLSDVSGQVWNCDSRNL